MSGTVTTIDLGFVNAYLVQADGGHILVDTGVSMQWRKLDERLRAAGCSRGGLRLVVLTHADMDHAGNAARVRDAYGAPVAAHAVDGDTLRTGERPPRTGQSPAIGAAMRVMRLFGGSRVLFAPEVTLRDGDRLDSWGLAARIIHLPGHTGGSIAVLTDEGDLVSGDACVNRDSPSASPYVENRDQYAASIEKLRVLASKVRTVYPGHGAPFPGALLAGLTL